MPAYPNPDELVRGMMVEIEQGHGKEPIRGEVGAVLDDADPTGATVKLKSGEQGRVREVVTDSSDSPQPR